MSKIIVGMTDETPKPKRKRWRWFIAGVLLIVAVVVWWYWPRGDARFVGKWQWTRHRPEDATVQSPGDRVIVLRRNGTGASYNPAGTRERAFVWSAGNQLYVEGCPTLTFEANMKTAEYQSRLPASLRLIPVMFCKAQVDEIGSESIKLSTSTEEIVLTRIAD